MRPESKETLLISSGGGPAECRQAITLLLPEMEADAERSDVALDISERKAQHGPSSVIMVANGKNAGAFAKKWEGVVQWRCKSLLRPRHSRKNWFIQVFRLPAARNAPEIDPQKVSMEAIRAGGPGGQHQNKTSSAIRARWSDQNGKTYAVVVRDDRSQHQNRRIALQRLSDLVCADIAESEAAQKGQTWCLHREVQRGEARHIFKGPRFQPVGANGRLHNA